VSIAPLLQQNAAHHLRARKISRLIYDILRQFYDEAAGGRYIPGWS